jgi:hypothetical protein
MLVNDVLQSSHLGPTADQAALQGFLGTLRAEEPMQLVRKRVDAAIEEAIAPLSWALRLVARPALRFVAQTPEWITIQYTQGVLSIAFPNGVDLRAPLGGPARLHQLPGGTQGEARHFLALGQLHTVITSELGEITNRYERVGGELIGHAELVSQHLPQPVRYAVRLTRRPA